LLPLGPSNRTISYLARVQRKESLVKPFRLHRSARVRYTQLSADTRISTRSSALCVFLFIFYHIVSLARYRKPEGRGQERNFGLKTSLVWSKMTNKTMRRVLALQLQKLREQLKYEGRLDLLKVSRCNNYISATSSIIVKCPIFVM